MTAIRFFSRFSFSTKIALGSSAIVLFVGVLSAVIVSQMVAKTLVTENKQRGLALSRNLAARAVDPMLARDLLRLKNLVDQSVVTEQGVEYALVLDNTDVVLAHSFHGGFPQDLLTLAHQGPSQRIAHSAAGKQRRLHLRHRRARDSRRGLRGTRTPRSFRAGPFWTRSDGWSGPSWAPLRA